MRKMRKAHFSHTTIQKAHLRDYRPLAFARLATREKRIFLTLSSRITSGGPSPSRVRTARPHERSAFFSYHHPESSSARLSPSRVRTARRTREAHFSHTIIQNHFWGAIALPRSHGSRSGWCDVGIALSAIPTSHHPERERRRREHAIVHGIRYTLINQQRKSNKTISFLASLDRLRYSVYT
jgi:hypothetical protein